MDATGAQRHAADISGISATHENTDAAHLGRHLEWRDARVSRVEQRIARTAEDARRRGDAAALCGPVVHARVVVDEHLRSDVAVGQIVDHREPYAGTLCHEAMPASGELIVIDADPVRPPFG